MKCELNMLKFNLEGSLNFERVWFFWSKVLADLKNNYAVGGQFTKQIWTWQFGNVALVVWNW